MKPFAAAVVVVCCSCGLEPLEPVQQPPIDWGGVKVRVFTEGQVVNPASQNTYVVALDSAIQGYGLLGVFNNRDSVIFSPVMAGAHQTTLRDVKPNCIVAGGVERFFDVRAGAATVIDYTVTCIPGTP
jgi:hypothetical protein